MHAPPPRSSLLSRLGDLGASPTEGTEEALRRRMLLLGAGLMSCGGVVWGGIALGFGLSLPALVPIGYVVATALNLAAFARSRAIGVARFIQVLLSLLLPFMFQASLGGFVNSGAVMIWAMIAIVGSLVFSDGRGSALWLGLYAGLTILSGTFDEVFVRAAPFRPGPAQVAVFFVANLVTVSLIVFGLAIYHTRRREQALAALLRERETNLALMEKLGAERARAEEAVRLKALFLANMSHEIRTPMNAVIGLSDLALREELQPRARLHFQRIRRAGSSLLGIIDDILDFSKLEAGGVLLEAIPFDLDDCLSNALSMVQHRADQKGLALRREIAPATPPQFVGDPLRLGQVLLNLLSNAVKFTETGEVLLSAAVSPRDDARVELELRVRDTGIGLSAEAITRLFQPFTQADTSTTRRFGGTGLGLAICDRLVRAMEGTLTVESTPGAGSTFIVRVPLAVAPPDADCDASASAPRRALNVATPKPDAPTTVLEGLRVLVAEDNEINAEIAVAVLEAQGAKTEVVTDGAQAVQRVLAGHFDLVLMDVQMPVMDGLHATRAIRAAERAIPVIGLSASVLAEDRDEARAAGMDDHLGKPFDPAALIRLVAQHCARRERVAEATPALLDLATVEARLGAGGSLVSKLLDRFVQIHGGDLEAFDEAFARGDNEVALRLVHTLQGAAGGLGAARLAAVSAELQRALRQGSVAVAELTRWREVFRETLAQMREVARARASVPPPSTAKPPPGP